MSRAFAAVLCSVLCIAPFTAMARPASQPTYSQVKSAMLHTYDKSKEFLWFRKFKATALRTDGYDLYNCLDGSEFAGTGSDKRTSAFADIAFDLVLLETQLPAIGYPASVWHADVRSYEETQVRSAGRITVDQRQSARDAFYRSVQKDLLAYRRRHPRLPQIVVGRGCGGAEVTVTIRTQPRGAQVLLIPSFFYELCRVQKLNPNNTNLCDHWREALDGTVDLIGNYHYFARWHDGTVRRGTLLFDTQTDKQTIMLRKP